ncbi:MAG: hypothetical protein ACYSU1_02550 [Planctomycetota bacterium]|jgi:hypothetical protein
MRYFTSGCITLALLLTACSTSDPQPTTETGPITADFGSELSQPFREILFQAPTWEIVAIDPDWPTEESRADPTTLHGYTVRGRADLPERSLRLELLESLADGARENDGMVAACFNPRHAIRAEFEGKVCEIIICFECLTFQVWDGSERVETVDLSETPRTTFDRIYRNAGLSIAPRGH